MVQEETTTGECWIAGNCEYFFTTLGPIQPDPGGWCGMV